MANRTTAAAVQGIITVDTSVNGGDPTPFIDAANSLVTELGVPAGYDDTRLELLERWLAAHFYCTPDPQSQAETAKGVGQTFEGRADGRPLSRSRYGQQVMLLDTMGVFSRLNEQADKGTRGRRIGVVALGKRCPPAASGFNQFPGSAVQ